MSKKEYRVFDGERLTLDSSELNWLLNELNDDEVKDCLAYFLYAKRKPLPKTKTVTIIIKHE
jgi:hypothetical protein